MLFAAVLIIGAVVINHIAENEKETDAERHRHFGERRTRGGETFMSAPLIALVGDYNEEVVAHRCIPDALRLASAPAPSITFKWIATTALADGALELEPFSAVWLVPASPYASMDGALSAVRFARETDRPF